MVSVVPLVGTWIEIFSYNLDIPIETVVPLVGTWIEIRYSTALYSQVLRRSPCGNVD